MASRQAEGRIVTKILAALRSRGFFAFKHHGSSYSSAGISDIICCAEGRYVAIEVKQPDKLHTLTRIQEFHLKEVSSAGGIAGVATSVEEALEIVEEGLKEIESK